uniref:Uncharacterized protein n=1 Tax=Arundo donax TaxID=35708 RepID=A0A0A8Y5S0_ARUDO
MQNCRFTEPKLLADTIFSYLINQELKSRECNGAWTERNMHEAITEKQEEMQNIFDSHNISTSNTSIPNEFKILYTITHT